MLVYERGVDGAVEELLVLQHVQEERDVGLWDERGKHSSEICHQKKLCNPIFIIDDV